MSEDSLLRYLAKPSRRRLAEAVREHHDFVWNVAFKVTGNREDAADICQEVFLKLLLEPPDRHTVTSPRGYLAWRILGRAASLRRSVQRRRAKEAEAAQQASKNGLSRTEAEELFEAIASLPDDLRLPIELHYLTGLADAEIAATLGIAERTVRDRLARAREGLKAKLSRKGVPAMILAGDWRWSAAPPPHELLPGLLRICDMGTSLTLRSAIAMGGLIVMKKIMVAAAAVLLLSLLAVVAVREWPVRRSADRAAPEVAGTPSIAPKAAAAPEGTSKVMPPAGEKPAVEGGERRSTILCELRDAATDEVLTLMGVKLEDEQSSPFRGTAFKTGETSFTVTFPAFLGPPSITAWLPGYRKGTFDLKAILEEIDDLPENGSAISLTLEPGLTVSGIVLDGTTGAPVASANVAFHRREYAMGGIEGLNPRSDLGESLTGPDGTFETPGIDPRIEVVLRVEADGHARHDERMVFPEGKSLEGVVIRLELGYSLDVKVRTENQDWMASLGSVRIKVHPLSRSENERSAEIPGDEEPHFLFLYLSAATYSVNAYPAAIMRQIYRNPNAEEDSIDFTTHNFKTVEVGNGGPGEVEIVICRVRGLRGRVVYEDGRPAVGANLFPIMAGHEGEVAGVKRVANDDGCFILHGMNPGGTYKLRFHGAYVRGQQDLDAKEDGAMYVVQRQPMRRVRFVPLGPDGPLDFSQLCIVMFDHPDGPTKNTSTVYEPAKETDSVDLGIFRRVLVFSPQTKKYAPVILSAEEIRGPKVPITFQESPVLRGRIIREDGRPVQNAKIEPTIEGVRHTWHRGAQTGGDGRFEIDALPLDPSILRFEVSNCGNLIPVETLRVRSFDEPATFVLREP